MSARRLAVRRQPAVRRSSIDAAAYPLDWNTAGFGFYDLRGELAAAVRCPSTGRHTLTLDARGRDLVGSPAGERVLSVGGDLLQPLARKSDQPGGARDPLPVPAPRRAVRRTAAGLRGLSVRGGPDRHRQRPLPSAVHHRPRLGFDAVGAPALVIQRSTWTCSRWRPAMGATPASTPPRGDRCRCASPSGSSRSPSSTSSPTGHGRQGRDATGQLGL